MTTREEVEKLAAKLAELSEWCDGLSGVGLPSWVRVPLRDAAALLREQAQTIAGLSRQLTETIDERDTIDVQLAAITEERDRLRKIAAHIPGAIYIKAKEAAGYGVKIRLMDIAKAKEGS